MSFGDVVTVRELLDIDPGKEDEKISRLLKLSNTWLTTFAPSDVISDLSTATKDAAVNYHCVYIFRLSAEKYGGDYPVVANEWRDAGVRILKNGIRALGKIYKIYKVND